MKVISTKGTRGSVKIEFEDGKKIVVTSELTMTPIFYADISSIVNWEPPHNNEVIDKNTKNKIINSIEEYSKTGEIPIVFD